MCPTTTVRTEHLDQLLVRLLAETGPLHTFCMVKGLYRLQYQILIHTGWLWIESPFVRLPHGPVLDNYRYHIDRWNTTGIIEVDETPATPPYTGVRRLLSLGNGVTPVELDAMLDAAIQDELKAMRREVRSGDVINSFRVRAYDTPPMKRIQEHEDTHEVSLDQEDVLNPKWVRYEDFASDEAYGRYFLEQRRKRQPTAGAVLNEDLALLERMRPFRPTLSQADEPTN